MANSTLRYKFVELATVREDVIEAAVNEWVGQGWTFEDIRFITIDTSRRPTMAFLWFVRHDPPSPPPAPAEPPDGAEPAEPADVSDPESPSPSTRRRRR